MAVLCLKWISLFLVELQPRDLARWHGIWIYDLTARGTFRRAKAGGRATGTQTSIDVGGNRGTKTEFPFGRWAVVA